MKCNLRTESSLLFHTLFFNCLILLECHCYFKLCLWWAKLLPLSIWITSEHLLLGLFHFLYVGFIITACKLQRGSRVIFSWLISCCFCMNHFSYTVPFYLWFFILCKFTLVGCIILNEELWFLLHFGSTNVKENY